MSHAAASQIRRKSAWYQWSLMTMLSVTATVAWLCGVAALAQYVDTPRPSGGTWLAAAAAILTIYYWRYQITTSESARTVKAIKFAGTLLLLLPYVYIYAGLIADWARLPTSKWLGDPVWVYAIPTVSFVVFDLRQNSISPRTCLLRSVAELVVIVPAWTYAWIIAQMYFRWWWM